MSLGRPGGMKEKMVGRLLRVKRQASDAAEGGLIFWHTEELNVFFYPVGVGIYKGDMFGAAGKRL